MKKLIMPTAIFIATCSITLGSYAYHKESKISNDLLQNLEALSFTEGPNDTENTLPDPNKPESGGSNNTLVRNFRSATVYLIKSVGGSITASFTKPSASANITIENIVCCVNGKDIDGCDFNLEDSKCARYVIRNSRF